MTGRAPAARPQRAGEALKAAAFDLGAEPALIVDQAGSILAANAAAEALLGHSLAALLREPDCADSFAAAPGLVWRRLAGEAPVRAHGVEVGLPGQPATKVDITAAPLISGAVLVTLQRRGPRPEPAAGLRSLVGLGRMLAHEINNPLAGIRGAAQLLRAAAAPGDIPLAQLIIDETDRIGRLVGRMEAFAGDAPLRLRAINIHRVLDRVRALAANGVADGIAMREVYDPSLPPAWGDEDQLIQLFLNLAKNAAEAARARGDGHGEITLSTRFRHGARLRRPDGRVAGGAPLEVKVLDNGAGVPAHLRDHLFEPFVTGRAGGEGLGLALAAKIVAGHRGQIDFESEAGRTEFRVRLPTAPEDQASVDPPRAEPGSP